MVNLAYHTDFMSKQTFSIAQALQMLLDSKKKLNPRYSMRALARDLDVDQSNLSKLIKGKRKATSEQILKISKSLNLPSDAIVNLLERE